MDRHKPKNKERTEDQSEEMRKRAQSEKVAPPPHEPRLGEDYRIHPRPVPGVDMPGEVPGDDLKSGGRKDGLGYDHGSSDGRWNEQFWHSEESDQ